MDLVITEKDVVARDCVRALAGRKTATAWPVEAGGYVFIPARGHLLELVEPEVVDEKFADRHDMSQLPIHVGKTWPKAASSKVARERISALKKALKECDGKVYCCGDADDEGQLIVDELIEYLGYNPSDNRFMRVFINDNLDANIRKAFNEAEPNSKYVGQGRAALARSLADFSFGINESRLATHEIGERADIGRVQTPTLGLVIARDAAIEGHKKRLYQTLKVDVDTEQGEVLTFEFKPSESMCEDGKHIFDKAIVNEVAKKLAGFNPGNIEVKREEKAKEPPLPFDMTSLAAHMASEHKLTAKQTMEVSQKLRDTYRAITYNRSSSAYLKEEHFTAAPDTCKSVLASLGTSMPVSFDVMRKTFDDSKVSGHHGIIPQDIELNLDLMNADEKAMYTAIAERYLAQFLPAITYGLYSASFTLDGVEGIFKLSEKVLTDAGYAKFVLKSDANKFNGTPHDAGTYTARAIESSNIHIEEHETTPPKRYTDGTLMVDMSRAAKFVRDKELKDALIAKDEGNAAEHGSIGTAATRADIIESLVAKGYLERKKNSLISTQTGRALFSIIPADAKGIDLTARWYLIQKDIEAGKADTDDVSKSVEELVVKHMKEDAYKGKSLSQKIGVCPLCGADVIKKPKSYSCVTNKYTKDGDSWQLLDGCGFSFPAKFAGKGIAVKQAENLLAGKRISLKGAKSKGGKKFDATLEIKNGKLTLVTGNKPKNQ